VGLRADHHPATRERLTATILVAAVHDGSLRPDVEAGDVTTLLGVFLATTENATETPTGALLNLLVDALRPAAQQYGEGRSAAEPRL